MSSSFFSTPQNAVSGIQYTTRRLLPAKVPLANHSHINCLDRGLVAVLGAQDIISVISTRRLITKLVLGHNDLGDDGTVVLFRFLRSSVGRRHKIAEISLNANGIGDRGLSAIAEYLRGNETLRELFLQNNAFKCKPDVISTFTAALNSSHLAVLSLTTNRQLSDAFLSVFLPQLASQHLRQLHLSVIGLTYHAAPVIAAFISDRERCKLQILQLNGNTLGLKGAKRIVEAVERANWSLLKVELYSNKLEPGNEVDEDEAESERNTSQWQDFERRLRAVLTRNLHLKKVVEGEALGLLRVARTLLLARPLGPSASPLHGPPRLLLTAHPASALFPFCEFPLELQHYILSFLAPSLSPAQRIRIYTYASSFATLPPLALRFPGYAAASGCIPDPGSLAFGARAGCTGGRCMGAANSVQCRKEEERVRWLSGMGCEAYDPGV